ncbi:MAG: O-antigen ligase family protein [Thermodesulfovibrionales bacterium]
MQDIIYTVLLFCISVMYSVLLIKNNKIVKAWDDSTKRLFIPLLLYFVFGFFAVVLHEQGFDAVKRYLIYLFAPLIIFLSIFAIYRNNKSITIALHILFFLGVVFSIYSIFLHTLSDEDIRAMHGLSSIYEREYLMRFTIPGLGPNVFPSMSVPIILTGFYLIRNISGKSTYLYIGLTSLVFYNVVITPSRGAFVSLIAGMIYLALKGRIKFNKKTIIVVLSFSLVLFISGDFLFSRIGGTNALLQKALAEGVTDDLGKSETRLVSLIDSFTTYIIPNPILGSGFTYFKISQDEKLQGVGEHNLYTTLLAQGGLVIFIPFILILAFLYFNSSKILDRNMFADLSSKDIGILLNAGLIAYIVDLNFPPGFFYYYWIWFGFVAAWTRNCEAEYRAQSKLL